MLVALDNDTRIIAHKDTERKKDYKCPCCHDSVILKAGKKKIAHFAHKSKSECSHGAGETQAHLKSKLAIYNDLIKSHNLVPDDNIFLEFRSDDGSHIADILYVDGDVARVIEIQHSPIADDVINERTLYWSKLGAYVMWVIPQADSGFWHRGEVRLNSRWEAFRAFHKDIYVVDEETGMIARYSHKLTYGRKTIGLCRYHGNGHVWEYDAHYDERLKLNLVIHESRKPKVVPEFIKELRNFALDN